MENKDEILKSFYEFLDKINVFSIGSRSKSQIKILSELLKLYSDKLTLINNKGEKELIKPKIENVIKILEGDLIFLEHKEFSVLIWDSIKTFFDKMPEFKKIKSANKNNQNFDKYKYFFDLLNEPWEHYNSIKIIKNIYELLGKRIENKNINIYKDMNINWDILKYLFDKQNKMQFSDSFSYYLINLFDVIETPEEYEGYYEKFQPIFKKLKCPLKLIYLNYNTLDINKKWSLINMPEYGIYRSLNDKIKDKFKNNNIYIFENLLLQFYQSSKKSDNKISQFEFNGIEYELKLINNEGKEYIDVNGNLIEIGSS
jgi:hypothetical protein